MIQHNLSSLILRLGFGGMMLTHGWGKLNQLLNGNFSFPDPIGVGSEISLVLTVIGEFVCPVLLILGWKTKLASIPPAITMLVAAFIVHASDPWSNKEFPLLYFVGYLSIYFLGGGKYSLDWKLKKF
ncbi:MAG: DoxX family protein [Bacteroidota bacterium]